MTSHPRIVRLAASLACVCAFATTLGAMYFGVETENVPVDRLVQNLEQLVAASPADVRLKANLARVHAMAFSTKAAELPAWKDHWKEGVWFGNQPRPIPFGRVQQGQPSQQTAARAHLQRAIELYEEIIKANTQPLSFFDLTVRLGHAWCVEQSGDLTKAIAAYRDVLSRAWNYEGGAGTLGLGHPITPEAFSYLRPLLDPQKDAAELALWQDRAAKVAGKPRAVTPIAIPLRDGLTIDDVIAPSARVRFDADGTGSIQTWSWINGDAGWLVYDQRGTQQITSALQWFGSVTFWLFWDHGYEPLRALDNNRDGKLKGPELEHMAIWRDRNLNGVTDRGEFRPLADWQIVSLSCDYISTDDAHMAATSPRGVTFSDGSVRPTWDVILRQTR